MDITEQIPFEIPSNWEWCRVRNVSNSYIGLTYKPTDIDEKGTVVLRSCNIRNGKLALDDIVRVSSSISEKLLIEENDIIICDTREKGNDYILKYFDKFKGNDYNERTIWS